MRSSSSLPRFFVMSSRATRLPARELGPRGERHGFGGAIVDRAYVFHLISLVTTCVCMPLQGPNTAEKRPASPPATTIAIWPASFHFRTRTSSALAWTAGVVSPRRSSSGRALQFLEHRLPHPVLAPTRSGEEHRVLRADDEERRVVHRPPERAPLHRRRRGERRRELLGRPTSVVGDRERSVAREQRHGRGVGGEATLDVKRLPGARLLVLGEADPELAGVTERRPVERAGACPAGQREEQAQRPADRHIGARAGAECSHAAVDPERLAHGPVDDEDRACGLSGDRDSMGVEAGLERGLGSGDGRRGRLRAAPGEDGARGEALECRLAVRRRHGAERERRVGAAEHRLHPLGRRRDDR